MKRPPGFYFMVADWLSDPNLQSCSLAAQGLWANLLCLMHEAPDYGFLKFGTGENWKYYPPENCRKNFGSSKKSKIARRKSPENLRKISGKSPENLRKISVFRELEKQLGKDKDLIARRFVELIEAGVPSITARGFIYSRRMVREGESNALRRKRNRRYYENSDAFKTVHPTPPYKPPLSPFEKGDSVSSFGNEKQKRRRPTKAQIALRVGAETGNEKKSPAEKFKEIWFASGLPGEELSKAWGELRGDWRKIKPVTKH